MDDGEPRKLDTTVNLGALMRKDNESIDTALTDGMWGLDKVRQEFNLGNEMDTAGSHVVQSQRKQRGTQKCCVKSR